MTPPTTSRLRVLHVITSLGAGGAERQLEFLLRSSQHDASVVCLYFRGKVGESIAAAGSSVDLIGMAGWRKATAVVRLARHIVHHDPDVVHVHLLSAQLFGIVAARLARVRVIVSTEHSLMDDSIEGRPRSRWLRALYRLLERLTTRTVAVSERTEERLVEWGLPAKRICVIDNAIDFDAHAFDPAARDAVRQEWGFSDQTRVIGAVGRLVAVKRFETLLRAVAPLLAERDAHLVIVGTGTLAGRLEAVAVELGVSARLHLEGERPDAARLLNGFDVFVSPSRSETFGMAVVESVANGLPTIFEQSPALELLDARPDWIVHVTSLSDPGHDDAGHETLRRAVSNQLDSPQIRRPVPDGLRSRYDIASTAAAYDHLYDDLVDAARQRHP